MATYYFKRWNGIQDRPLNPMSEKVAAKRFESGPWFSVALTDDPRFGDHGVVPDALLELEPQARVVKVYHFTPAGSVATIYIFDRQGDRLFLSQAFHYTYADDQQHTLMDSTVVSSFDFDQDGTVTIRDDDTSRPTISSSERRGVDLSSNWEPVPAFGDWASLSRRER
jgi:hypothetical protein